MTKTKTTTQTWTVTFTVVAPRELTHTDIETAIEEALDDGRALAKYLDATFITAHKQ
jgi:hypothetical protein